MNNLIMFPKKNTENNREYAYRLLRYNIMNLRLLPGETLNENEICQLLNVSRTPIHEALTILKSEQLVQIVPQSGSYVSLIHLKNIREGLFLRNEIEPAIYNQIAGKIPIEYLDEMSKNLDTAEALLNGELEQSHIHDLIQLDDQFHQLAYLAAEKSNIWGAMKTVCSHLDRVRYLGHYEQMDDYNKNHADHRKLYEFLLLGGKPSFDLDSFYYDHLSQFHSYFPTLYENHPEYFSNK